MEAKKKVAIYLASEGYEVIDHGTDSDEPVDYPLMAQTVFPFVLDGDRAILICGTGQGMAMAANHLGGDGIRAALCWNEEVARLSREHNDANILCLGARTMDPALIEPIVKAWLSTEFTCEERHVRRIRQMELCD